jgi:hypothetical protein
MMHGMMPDRTRGYEIGPEEDKKAVKVLITGAQNFGDFTVDLWNRCISHDVIGWE